VTTNSVDVVQVVRRVDVVERPRVVDVAGVGVQGQPGPQGPPGADGADGVSYDPFQHVQASPSSSWVVEHGFGRLVHVTLANTAGELVEADVVQTSPNVVSVSFPAPTTGTAFIS
jgi:hypothetical protein